MGSFYIKFSKRDVLYIIERLDFDEISVPRNLMEEFYAVELLFGISLAEANRVRDTLSRGSQNPKPTIGSSANKGHQRLSGDDDTHPPLAPFDRSVPGSVKERWHD